MITMPSWLIRGDRVVLPDGMRPAAIRVDNGPELLAQVFVDWCADRGIAVLVSRPFMNGAYFERLGNVPLPDWAAEFGCASWAQFSLQYILANPAVTCVLTETTSAEHMAENTLVAFAPVPDKRARRRMRSFRFWMRGKRCVMRIASSRNRPIEASTKMITSAATSEVRSDAVM